MNSDTCIDILILHLNAILRYPPPRDICISGYSKQIKQNGVNIYSSNNNFSYFIMK